MRADTDPEPAAKPLYLPERQTATRLNVSPDARFVLVTLAERAKGDSLEGRQVTLPSWVTQSGYVETQQIRTKVGDAQSRERAALIEVATGKTTWIDSVGAGERNAVGVGISANGRHALIRVTTTGYTDAWLAVVDLPSLATRIVAHLHDDAWLDGPLASTAGWLKDGETVYYGSEETGYAHLYTVPASGGAPRALTRGMWEGQEVSLAPDGKTLYLHTNEGDFGQVHFHALDVATGRKTQLTSAEGRQDVVVSPDGKLLAVLHSTANHPPELYFQANRPGGQMRKVTESTTSEWRSFGWISPEIVMIPARDGVRVPARLYRPTAAANHAAVLFVHGAGYLQNVHKWWAADYPGELVKQLLASDGYAVLDLDYRGSARQGRDSRTAHYRHMGGKDLDDQVDGARWLVQHLGVDSTKLGIYGGSYGRVAYPPARFSRA